MNQNVNAIMTIFSLLCIAAASGQIVRRVALDGTGYKILRCSPQYLCCADFAGGIDLRSKDNLQVRLIVKCLMKQFYQEKCILQHCGWSSILQLKFQYQRVSGIIMS